MVHITQNHWVCGICPSSEILNNLKTQCFGLRVSGGSDRLALSKRPNRVGVSFLSPKDGIQILKRCVF
jgi:hypothetical protein